MQPLPFERQFTPVINGVVYESRPLARTALSHHICTGVSRLRLGPLIAELADPWMAGEESRLGERRGLERLRAEGGVWTRLCPRRAGTPS